MEESNRVMVVQDADSVPIVWPHAAQHRTASGLPSMPVMMLPPRSATAAPPAALHAKTGKVSTASHEDLIPYSTRANLRCAAPCGHGMTQHRLPKS